MDLQGAEIGYFGGGETRGYVKVKQMPPTHMGDLGCAGGITHCQSTHKSGG